jgi:hypothetical protein
VYAVYVYAVYVYAVYVHVYVYVYLRKSGHTLQMER